MRKRTALLISVLCAILAHCGPPSWRGGVLANFAWSPRGVRVVDFPPDGPAAKAGLLPDDRIVAIDGQNVTGLSREQVQQRLSGEVGTFVVLTIERDGQMLDVRIERAPYKSESARAASKEQGA